MAGIAVALVARGGVVVPRGFEMRRRESDRCQECA